MLRDVHTHIWTDACLDDGRKVGCENKQAVSHYINSNVVEKRKSVIYMICVNT